MDWSTLFIVFLAILFLFFAMGQKIAFALGFASVLGFLAIGDTNGMQLIGRAVWTSLNSFEISAIPLFIFMGEIVVACKLSGRFYHGATAWFSRIPGGFLQTNVISCAIFAAISGSSVATAASIGSVSFPELDARGYDKKLNLGTLGAGGALGLLIPPSTTFLIYGAITGTSVSKLFIAGIIPGLLAAIFFMIYIMVRVRLNPALVPGLPPKSTWREKRQGLIDMLPFLLLMIMILVSIYMGWATPTEAAAFSAFMAVLFAAISRELSFKRLLSAAIKTVESSAMIFFIVIGAQIFSSLLTKSGISRGLLRWFVGENFSPLVFFVAICVIYIILGCLMDGTSVTYFTLPLLFPLVQAMGYDPIWFGVMVAILIEVGMITPPVGMNLFVLLGITGEKATFKDVCLGNLPFVILYLLLIIVIYAFPFLATWLPGSM